MKRICSIVLLLACAVLSCMLMSCGGKGKEEKAVAVVGDDTLTMGDLKKLAADTVRDAAKLRRIALQTSLAKKAAKPADTARYRQMVDEVAQQLSLRSDREWNTEEAAVLLAAARALKAQFDTVQDPGAVVRYMDSLSASVALLCKTTAGSTESKQEKLAAGSVDTTEAGRRTALAAAIRRAFALSPELAEILIDFAKEDASPEDDSVSVKDIVKGLVYDRSKAPDKETREHEARHVRRDNSALALRYRNRKSIVDSISRHMVSLEALYKKKLKVHQEMAGKVIVSLRVDASGRVMSARIVASDIRERDFLKPFLAYVKNIRFKPIPQKVGPMTFEFPFEFKAEG